MSLRQRHRQTIALCWSIFQIILQHVTDAFCECRVVETREWGTNLKLGWGVMVFMVEGGLEYHYAAGGCAGGWEGWCEELTIFAVKVECAAVDWCLIWGFCNMGSIFDNQMYEWWYFWWTGAVDIFLAKHLKSTHAYIHPHLRHFAHSDTRPK